MFGYQIFKVCKFTTEAIVTDGSEVGTMRKVCTNLARPFTIRSGKPAATMTDGRSNRRNAAAAKPSPTQPGCGFSAISAAVPVRLMKRDLLFLTSQIAPFAGDGRLKAIAKQHGINRSKDTENIGKLFDAYLRAEEETLSRVPLELTIVQLGQV